MCALKCDSGGEGGPLPRLSSKPACLQPRAPCLLPFYPNSVFTVFVCFYTASHVPVSANSQPFLLRKRSHPSFRSFGDRPRVCFSRDRARRLTWFASSAVCAGEGAAGRPGCWMRARRGVCPRGPSDDKDEPFCPGHSSGSIHRSPQAAL